MSRVAKAPPPRRRDAEGTRTAILKAATREFALHGFSGARTERIVTQAKSNIRLLYHHFGNKKGLYTAVLDTAYDDLREKETSLQFDLADPLGCIDRLMRFTFLYFQENPLFEALLRNENLVRGRFVLDSGQAPEAASGLKQILAQVTAAGEVKGQFRPDIDPVQLYVTIAALSRFHLANVHSLSGFSRDLAEPAWRAARLEHSAEMIRAYVQAPPAGD